MFKVGINYTRNALSPLRRMMSSQEPDVIFETVNNAGFITLNRPKALNAINYCMASKVLPTIREWENTKSLVIIKSSTDGLFCAGGDIISCLDKVVGHRLLFAANNYFYKLNNYKIPYIALMNGVTMGAGLGVSVHGRYRIATEKTVIAMPEVKIGYFTDVGGTYFLPRLQHNVGIYLGLTGDKLGSRDVVKAGIATHYVPSNRLHELEQQLPRCQSEGEVNSLLSKFHEPSDEFSLAPNIKHIDYCFAGSTIEEIIERLEKVQNEWSGTILKTLHQVCPGSLKLTLRALQRGAQLDLGQCLKMEYGMYSQAVEKYDFPEGVRAVLIDKDYKPKWNPKSLAEATDDYVESFFKKLPEEKELKFLEC